MTDREDRTKLALRLTACCVVLVAIAFIQDPGFVVDDTKLDLLYNPAGFLGRAAHLWDAQGAFGQLQNQAYGYLWPMGPFFLIGHWLGVGGWIVQRAWLALVMGTAFLGSARVARALGMRSHLALAIVGFAYALSPRMLTTLGPISIESWPSALAPWVLLPLILGSRRGSPRRAAALSALAVGMVGGVNAAATFAVIPLGVVWLLTREGGPRRRSLIIWWPVFTFLATAWWLVPLFVMGAYSPPFLDFIESTSVTTFPTTVFDALRGTSNWVPYIDARSRAGNDLVTDFWSPLNGGVVMMVGLAGLLLPRMPHRRFAVISLLTGLVLVTLGHFGAVSGWFSADLRHVLDGALAPLRNVHKFDPIVRLPMVLGVGWVTECAVRGWEDVARPSHWWDRTWVGFSHFAVVGLAVIALVGSAVPAGAGRLTPAGPMFDVPGYWRQAASWLADQSPQGTTLLTPGSSFGSYVWGYPGDEPLQFLAESPWAVRNAIPLSPPGNIRMLDAVQQRFADGRGSGGLTDYLRRAGVRYLLVRNDLQRGGNIVDPVLVHQTLAQSPGIKRVRAFGPAVGGAAYLLEDGRRTVINQGWQNRYPALEVFEVERSGEQFTQGERVPLVAGGPEDLLDLADAGMLRGTPSVLAVDAPRGFRPSGPYVLTDGLRRRERSFAGLADAYSAVLTPGDRLRSAGAASDYLPAGASRWQTTAELTGATSISAASSESDANNQTGAVPGYLPYAAVDGSKLTSWVSGDSSEKTPWWRVELRHPVPVERVAITASPAVTRPVSFRVSAQGARSAQTLLQPGETAVVRVGSRSSRWVQIDDAAQDGRQLGLAEVSIPGVEVRRRLRTPTLPARWGAPHAIVLSAGTPRDGCAEVGQEIRCVNGRQEPGDEDAALLRDVPMPTSADYRATVTARPLPGLALQTLLQQGQPLNATASTTLVDDPRGSGLAAVDNDPGTTWISQPDDPAPQLRLSWLGLKRLAGLDLSLNLDAPARRPTRLALSWVRHGRIQRREVSLNDQGSTRFAPIRTDELTLTVIGSEKTRSLGFDRGTSELGVGISQLRIRGLPYLPLVPSTQPEQRPCGTGPRLQLPDGATRSTTVTASAAQLYRGDQVTARVCGSDAVSLERGRNDLGLVSAPAFAAARLVLSAGPFSGAAVSRAGATTHDGQGFAVTPAPGGGVLERHQNTNPGWFAIQDGHRLEPLILDGWQQGWRLRGAGSVTGRFGPDDRYRWGLGLGVAAFAVLVAGLVLSRPRRGRRRVLDHVPPLGERRVSAWAWVPVGVGAAGLIGAWPGVVAGVAGAVAALVLGRIGSESRAWLVPLPVFLAGVAYAVQPWGSSHGWAGQHAWPQYLVLLALGAVAAGVPTDDSAPAARWRLRRAGGRRHASVDPVP